ncbi:efflux transporter outer membrane subunit [Sphingomonas glacialis]|uniref:Efflux transporter outer membrane subunit n=1 Tax=Sphingomonas glacialis TaxID=658225 RepID=A0A502FIY9_9SPHN|nr:efflux transporter outer membrane subunit [Sphingomonas glacialis]TPG49339.1 efflux transporter outer membrane subunit [Sphingomonas glacialis]
MRNRRSLSSLFGLMLLAGCTVGPDFVRPTPALPVAWQARGAAPAEARWWRVFSDPVLDALEDKADTANLDLRIALERIEAARATRGLARADAAPTLSGQASYSRERIGTKGIAAIAAPLLGLESVAQSPKGVDFNLYSVGAGANWELDLWGKHRRQIESAQASLAATDAEARGVRLSVQAEVACGYFQLRGLWAERRLAAERQAMAAQSIAIATTLTSRGLATPIDLAEAQSRDRQIRDDLSDLDDQAARASRALAVLIGSDPDAQPVAPNDAYALPAPEAPAGRLSSDLARNRPDIVAAEAKLHGATAAIGVAQADFYPNISLTGLFSLDALNLDALGWNVRNTSIGPSVSLPIFDGGRIRGQVAVRTSEQRGAALAYQQTVRGAWREVDDALGLVRTLQTRGTLADAELQARQQTVAALEARFRRGDIAAAPLLDARAAMVTAETARVRLRIAALLAQIQLRRGLGG